MGVMGGALAYYRRALLAGGTLTCGPRRVHLSRGDSRLQPRPGPSERRRPSGFSGLHLQVSAENCAGKKQETESTKQMVGPTPTPVCVRIESQCIFKIKALPH